MKRAAGVTFLLILVGLIAIPVSGDKAPSPAPSTRPAEEQSVTRFYDIRDLLVNIPDFDSPEMTLPASAAQGGGGAGGGGAGLFSNAVEISRPTRQEITERMIKSITDAIAPDSWKDTGGTSGIIREDRAVLIVTQTPGNQKRIAEFLAQYRKAVLPVPVRIQAHWIITRRHDLAASLRPVESQSASTRPVVNDPASVSTALLQADDAGLDKVPGAVHFRGEVVCMSGQQVSLTTVNTRSTTDITINPSNNTAETQLATNVGGLTLNMSNMLCPDRAGVLLTVRSQWSDPLPGPRQLPTTRPGDSAESNSALHNLRTTVRMPLGKTILVGGMTLDPTPGSSHPIRQQVGDEPLQMYLFINATAQPD